MDPFQQLTPQSQYSMLRNELELMEEFLQAEVTLGQCSASRLHSLCERRDRLRAQLEETQRTRLGLNIHMGLYRDKEKGIHHSNAISDFKICMFFPFSPTLIGGGMDFRVINILF